MWRDQRSSCSINYISDPLDQEPQMQLTTSLRKTASLVVVTAVAGSAALAGAAPAATYENARIVAVDATIARDERAQKVITVPKGFRIAAIGFAERGRIGARAENDYAGKRSVRLTLFANRTLVPPGEHATGTIYVLARRA